MFLIALAYKARSIAVATRDRTLVALMVLPHFTCSTCSQDVLETMNLTGGGGAWPVVEKSR